MPCKLCDRWHARLWEESDAWERAHSNESELWSEEPAENRALVDQAEAVKKTVPAAAFRLYLEAAEAGSAWAMEMVAFHYETGNVVAADLDKARDYYCRAIGAGSWMATIAYARFLAEQGDHDDCRRLLEDGVASDFVPAFFWLAWLRHKQCKARKMCREVRPLLEYAAGRGHPGAQVTLARWRVWGRFGLREIPAGIRSTLRMAFRAAREAEEDVDDQDAAVHAHGREQVG